LITCGGGGRRFNPLQCIDHSVVDALEAGTGGKANGGTGESMTAVADTVSLCSTVPVGRRTGTGSGQQGTAQREQAGEQIRG
jgi:hypothetical protein